MALQRPTVRPRYPPPFTNLSERLDQMLRSWLPAIVLFSIFNPSLAASVTEDKIGFWKGTPRGANISSENPETDFAAAKRYGLHLVRIGATGSPGDLRFLVRGTAPKDSWDLSAKNIRRLKEIIAKADRNNLKVVITLAHIPGRAWEYRERDNRIWQDEVYQQEFITAWKILSRALKDCNNVVAYDLINEPYLPQNSETPASKVWQLYRRTIGAIRTIDQSTPIIVESLGMASAAALPAMPVFEDDKVIYSFHYYEPFPYFAPPLNQGNYCYPGIIPSEEGRTGELWDKATHRQRLKAVLDWQSANHIEPYKIFVGEFGAWREANGASLYLEDLASLFEEFGWSWTYFAFREHDWNVADLEFDDQTQTQRHTELFEVLRVRFR